MEHVKHGGWKWGGVKSKEPKLVPWGKLWSGEEIHCQLPDANGLPVYCQASLMHYLGQTTYSPLPLLMSETIL